MDRPDFAVHSYPWYVADWRSSETRLRLAPIARYIYREMLDHCAVEGSCPDDPAIISRACDVSLREVNRYWDSIRVCFYASSGRLHNRKIDAILATKAELSTKRSSAGKAGGRPSVKANEKQLLNKDEANVKPTVTSTIPIAIPIAESERESAEGQQQPNPEPPIAARPLPDLEPDEPKRPRSVLAPPPSHLQPIREALAEATGSQPDDAIVEQLAYAGALHGAHPAVVARWIFRKARARGSIRSHGFFAAALPADLPGWLAETPRYADGAFSVQSRQACRCGGGEDVQFADCVMGHACPVMPRSGLKRLETAALSG